jgi:predicted metalloenzyme YecM
VNLRYLHPISKLAESLNVQLTETEIQAIQLRISEGSTAGYDGDSDVETAHTD